MIRLLLLIGTLGCANASPITWYLHGVHYSEHRGQGVPGYSLGQFTYDAQLNLLTGWDITDLGDYAPWFPSTFSSPGVLGCCPWAPLTASTITLSGRDSRFGNDFLFLYLTQPLTDNGGVVPLIPAILSSSGYGSGSREIIKQGMGEEFRYLDEGAYVSTTGPTTAPESPTWTTMLALAALLKRRWRLIRRPRQPPAAITRNAHDAPGNWLGAGGRGQGGSESIVVGHEGIAGIVDGLDCHGNAGVIRCVVGSERVRDGLGDGSSEVGD